MSTKNKKVTASDILLEYDQLQATLKEESKKIVASLLKEAVKDGLNDAIEDDEDEKEYEIKDDDSTDNEEMNDETSEEIDDENENSEDEFETGEEGNEEEGSESDDENFEGDGEEEGEEGSNEEWSEFDKYKVDDDTYDLSGEEDDEAVIKVYKLLKDTDKVVVKKEGNRAEIKDAETGAEYVIDFGDENPDVEKVSDGDEGEEEPDLQAINEAIDEYLDSWRDFQDHHADDFYTDDDDPDTVIRHEYLNCMRDGDVEGAERIKSEHPDLFVDDEEEGINNEDEEVDNMNGADPFESDPNMPDETEPEFTNEGKKSRKTMKENKEKVLFEVDLGITDNYQDKDPIEGLSNNEPSKGKRSWDAGVPTGTNKPWAGKGNSKPFEKKVNEGELDSELEDVETPDFNELEPDGDNFNVEDNLEEGATSVSTQSMRKETKSKTSAPRKEHAPKVTKNMSSLGKYEDVVNEVKRLKKENKMLKEAALKIKASLQEAVLVNVNLGQVVKILQENSTTTEEKNNIISRFNNVKSINESMALYESISRELAGTKRTITLEEKTMTATPAKQINESTVYENPGLAEIREMMNRIDGARI